MSQKRIDALIKEIKSIAEIQLSEKEEKENKEEAEMSEEEKEEKQFSEKVEKCFSKHAEASEKRFSALEKSVTELAELVRDSKKGDCE